jgi:amidohydrolase
MIGTMGAGAGVSLSKIIDSIGGRIVILGTSAEETNGAKVDMVEGGVFEGIDAAMIVHPSSESFESGISLAMDAIQFLFKGRAAHAASEPEKGINALDAVILTFNGINALRQHIKSNVRIHGIIKEGGLAANIVPERTLAQFYIRAMDRRYINEVVERVKNVARGATDLTITEQGHDALLKGVAALAYTGHDLIVDKELLKQVKDEFLSSTKTVQ